MMPSYYMLLFLTLWKCILNTPEARSLRLDSRWALLKVRGVRKSHVLCNGSVARERMASGHSHRDTFQCSLATNSLSFRAQHQIRQRERRERERDGKKGRERERETPGFLKLHSSAIIAIHKACRSQIFLLTTRSAPTRLRGVPQQNRGSHGFSYLNAKINTQKRVEQCHTNIIQRGRLRIPGQEHCDKLFNIPCSHC